ncbi:MAG: hypothetical protein Q8N96_04140 [Methylovulum sp.]|nr:hypothetical protein [Methylovulum sp.]
MSSLALVLRAVFWFGSGFRYKLAAWVCFLRASASSVVSHSRMRLRHARNGLGAVIRLGGVPRTTQAAGPVFGQRLAQGLAFLSASA